MRARKKLRDAREQLRAAARASVAGLPFAELAQAAREFTHVDMEERRYRRWRRLHPRACPCQGPEEDPGPHLRSCPWSDPECLGPDDEAVPF